MFQSFARAERLFILFAILVGFSISFEYAVTRPASNAIFLTVFSSKALPWVWLATVPLNLGVIFLYSHLLTKIGPLKTLFSIASMAIAINLISPFILPHFPGFIFFHYAWKDVYILLMFKQLWSMIHSTISVDKAKYLYGFIFGMGTLGSISGSFIPGFFASNLGSETLFFFTLPIYALMMLAYQRAFSLSSVETAAFQSPKEAKPSYREGFSLIRQNRFLIGVLLLVVLMQMSVGLMEYQFNAHLELNILEKDLRTEYAGKLVGIMNMLSGLFQIVGSYLLVHTLGLRGSHLFIPLLLFCNSLFSFMLPGFAMISIGYVFLKSVDFSLFGVIREMLYIPLKQEEKYRAKVVIDVFAYRTSKALVSLGILALQLFVGPLLLPILSTASVAVFCVWLLVVFFVLRQSLPEKSEQRS